MIANTPKPRRSRSKLADTALETIPAPSAIDEQQAQQGAPGDIPAAETADVHTPAVTTLGETEAVAPAPAEQAAPPSPAAKVTKAGQLHALLAAPAGATLSGLCDALGWQSHTVRAALTRLRQAGHSVERSKAENGQTVYHIGPGEAAKATDAPVASSAGPAAKDPAQLEGAIHSAANACAPEVSTPSETDTLSEGDVTVELIFSSKRSASPFAALQDGEDA